MKKRIAFITYSDELELTPDDRLVLTHLNQLGISVDPVPWEKGVPATNAYESLIFRSCWNYHVNHQDFENWLRKLAVSGVPIWNPVETLLWNLNKKYLLDLHKEGVKIPITKFFQKGTTLTREDLFLGNDIFSIVVKPSVSLNGFDTYRFSSNELESAFQITSKMVVDRDILVQEFLSAINHEGETSLVFFNGQFSHAIQKKPKAGEFRVQLEHGGTRMAVEVSPWIIGEAREILKCVGSPLLYGRVDGVISDNVFTLMELEIIDPMLFLAYHPDAAARFAQAINAKLS